MQYLSHFVEAFLIFIAPLSFLDYKTNAKQKVLFTVLYGLGIYFSRQIYNFTSLPFGIHIFILIGLSSILFKNILKNYTWKNSIYISLIVFIALLINDSIFLLPYMSIYDLTIEEIQMDNGIIKLIEMTMSNLILIAMYIIGRFKNRKSSIAIEGENIEAKNI